MAGHEHRIELVALVIRAIGDDRHRVDARHIELLQGAQHLVFAAGELRGCLLDRDHVAAEVHESHQVSRDTLRQGGDHAVWPGVERQVPRQVEESGVDRRRSDVEGTAHVLCLF